MALCRRHTDDDRYDAQDIRLALELTAGAYQTNSSLLTAEQIEDAAAEVGLDAAEVRHGLRQAQRLRVYSELRRSRRKEFVGLLGGMGLAIAWSIISWFWLRQSEWYWFGGNSFSTFLFPVLLALIQGFAARRAPAAFMLGMLLAVGVAPTFWAWIARSATYQSIPDPIPHAMYAAFGYVALAGPALGVLSVIGGRLRAYYFQSLQDAD